MLNNNLNNILTIDENNLTDLNNEIIFNSINYLLVLVKKSVEDLSIFPAISVVEVDSQEVYINYDNNKYIKTGMFSNYTIGIILADGNFLKKDYSLKMHPDKINNNHILSSVNITLKSQFDKFIEFPKNFRFVSLTNNHLQPISLPCNILKADNEKKYLDLSISRFYEIL